MFDSLLIFSPLLYKVEQTESSIYFHTASSSSYDRLEPNLTFSISPKISQS